MLVGTNVTKTTMQHMAQEAAAVPAAADAIVVDLSAGAAGARLAHFPEVVLGADEGCEGLEGGQRLRVNDLAARVLSLAVRM
jgi:hypothetical protein